MAFSCVFTVVTVGPEAAKSIVSTSVALEPVSLTSLIEVTPNFPDLFSNLIINLRSASAITLPWEVATKLPSKITVLADVAVRSQELDAERAKQALEAAEKQLKAADSDKARATAEAALAAAIAQLKTLDYLRNRRH